MIEEELGISNKTEEYSSKEKQIVSDSASSKEKEIYNGSPHVILNLLECIRSVYSDTNFNVEGVNNRSKSLNNSVLINYNY